MKPESYPFLKIARKHNLDYGDVLDVADYIRSISNMFEYTMDDVDKFRGYISRVNSNAATEIVKAALEFYAIQSGKIDWQTGENIEWDGYDGPDKDYRSQV